MLHRLSAFIVSKRRVILITVVFLAVLCCFFVDKVSINYDFTSYLGRDTETRRSLELMQREFGATETVTVLLKNAPEGAAKALQTELNDLDGVVAASFEESRDVRDQNGSRYERISLLLDQVDSIAFSKQLDKTLSEKEGIGEYKLGGSAAGTILLEDKIASEIPIAMLIAAFVVLVVLLLTSHSFFEPVVFLLVLVVSILINMGTNFIFGTISFITFAVCAILQLALAMDYSIMLLHTYFEIRDSEPDDKKALILALERTMMPISSSALTTVSGLVSLMFMSFTIGFDIGIVLSKGIIITMLCVFTFMPALIMLFSKPLHRMRHRTLTLGGRQLGAFAAKKPTRIIAPVLLIGVIVISALLGQKIIYTFTDQTDSANPESESRIFGTNNSIVVLLPSDGTQAAYARQKEFVDEILQIQYQNRPAVKNVNSIVTTGEAVIKTYTLDEAYELVSSFSGEGKPLAISKEVFEGFLSEYKDGITAGELMQVVSDLSYMLVSMGRIGQDEIDLVESAKAQLDLAQKMYTSERYSRLIVTLDVPLQGEESERVLTDIISLMQRLYPGEQTGITGHMMSVYDISHAFRADLTKVNLITIFAMFLIVLISFKNFLIPVLLICAIQGAVWINFALSVPAHIDVFFMCYLICLAIQMGATIDYGILLTTNYVRLRKEMGKKEALEEAMRLSLPTILTSGLILFGAGLVIGKVCTVYYIYSIGLLIASGTVFSMMMVLLLLPTMLYNCDRLIVRKNKNALRGNDDV